MNNLDSSTNNIINKIKLNLKKVAYSGLDNLEPIEHILGNYYNEFIRNLIPKDLKYKYLIMSIHIIHFIGVFVIVLFGLFLPPKLQKYLFLYYLFIIITWLIWGKCILIILTNYIGNTKHDFLFPFKYKTFYFGVGILMIISLLFYIFPKISFFNILLLLNKYLY